MRRLPIAAVAVVCSGLLLAHVQAAETVHLRLSANGNDIQGESTVTSLGREGTIECLSLEHQFGGRSGGRRGPSLVVTKRIDRATPLLMQAADANQEVVGTFRFYRPNPAGDGTTEQFFTITVRNARIVSVRHMVLDVLGQETSLAPPLEEVVFAYRTIEVEYTDGGITYQTEVAAEVSAEDTATTADEGVPPVRRLRLRRVGEPE